MLNGRRLLLAICWLATLLGGPAEAAFPYRLSDHYETGDSTMRIRLLGAVQLPVDAVNGYPMVELSGLAWDEDEQILYALSDHGRLFHLRPVFTEGVLSDIEILDAFALTDKQGKSLRGKSSDSEGLAIRNHRNGHAGDTRLIVSFERVTRVLEYSPDGTYQTTHPIPQSLKRDYAYSNAGLEAIAILASGEIVTSPERPAHAPDSQTTVFYGLAGHRWIFPRYPAPNSSVVGMDTLPDGSLVTLERSFTSVWLPLLIILRKTAPLTAATDQPIAVEEIAVLNSYEGWRLDNFEGLAHHRAKRFFLVSDDNENPLQKSLLIYLEILDEVAESNPGAAGR